MANDLAEIKQRIYNEEKIFDLFESLECENIKFEQNETLLTAQLPARFNSSNSRAVQCRINEGLWCSIRNRGDFEGDIFNLVAYLKYNAKGDEMQKMLSKSKLFICNKFGWQDLLGKNQVRKADPLSAIKAMRYKGSNNKGKVNKVISENVLKDYIQLPNIPWIKEGISYNTQVEYGIGFDLETHRITIPTRNRFGQLIGVKGRMFKDEEVTDYDPKYLYLHKCNQSYEWFNMYIARNAIKKQKEVIIVEGEKSCMKFFQNGIYNVVAICSSDVTKIQRDIIYSLGRDIRVVLAYDSDKTVEEVQRTAELFEQREVSMIYDTDKLLPKKTAPIDLGIEVWNKLYKNNQYNIY